MRRNLIKLGLKDLQVSVLPLSQSVAGGESIFRFRCQLGRLGSLNEAKIRLSAFLANQRPQQPQPFDFSYGLMTGRSETVGGAGTFPPIPRSLPSDRVRFAFQATGEACPRSSMARAGKLRLTHREVRD
jgi:hypothetical protein